MSTDMKPKDFNDIFYRPWYMKIWSQFLWWLGTWAALVDLLCLLGTFCYWYPKLEIKYDTWLVGKDPLDKKLT